MYWSKVWLSRFAKAIESLSHSGIIFNLNQMGLLAGAGRPDVGTTLHEPAWEQTVVAETPSSLPPVVAVSTFFPFPETLARLISTFCHNFRFSTGSLQVLYAS